MSESYTEKDEDKALSDAIQYVYNMLSLENDEVDKEPAELRQDIRAMRHDEKLIIKIDDVCFALLTSLQERSLRVNGTRLLANSITYESIVELVGKLCVFLIRRESQLAAGSLVDGEVSESVDTSLPQEVADA